MQRGRRRLISNRWRVEASPSGGAAHCLSQRAPQAWWLFGPALPEDQCPGQNGQLTSHGSGTLGPGYFYHLLPPALYFLLKRPSPGPLAQTPGTLHPNPRVAPTPGISPASGPPCTHTAHTRCGVSAHSSRVLERYVCIDTLPQASRPSFLCSRVTLVLRDPSQGLWAHLLG